MPRLAIAFTLALAACASAMSGGVPFVPPPRSAEEQAMIDRGQAFTDRVSRENRENAEREAALTPQQRAGRDRLAAEARQKAALDAARTAREAELLQRALTASPDYAAALHRAAVANIEASPAPPQPGPRPRPETPAAREARITAEETRLSDMIESRRREQLARQQQGERNARAQGAIAECEQRGAQIDAAYYNPRSILNLDGAIAGAQARNQCIEAYRRMGVLQ